jgi:hypothetical protein
MNNPHYKNSSKHRAQHGNYYKKPTQQGVNALRGLYEGIDEISKELNNTPPKAGEQTKMKF